jgi:hypothetical protein
MPALYESLQANARTVPWIGPQHVSVSFPIPYSMLYSLGYLSVLNKLTYFYSEASVNFYQTTWRSIPKCCSVWDNSVTLISPLMTPPSACLHKLGSQNIIWSISVNCGFWGGEGVIVLPCFQTGVLDGQSTFFMMPLTSWGREQVFKNAWKNPLEDSECLCTYIWNLSSCDVFRKTRCYHFVLILFTLCNEHLVL